MPIELHLQSAPSGRRSIEGQPAGLVAVRETGLMWANMLGAFQVGKALTSDEGPASWMRRSCVALVQVSCPACHLTSLGLCGDEEVLVEAGVRLAAFAAKVLRLTSSLKFKEWLSA